MEDPFQNVSDASTADFGAKQVMLHTSYHAIEDLFDMPSPDPDSHTKEE